MLVDLLQVDNIEKLSDIVRPAVLIEQIVGMLPHIQPENRKFALTARVVLIGGGNDLQFAVVHNQPGPAAAEYLSCRTRKSLLETVKAAEFPFSDEAVLSLLTTETTEENKGI
jgi:hypothetical protein